MRHLTVNVPNKYNVFIGHSLLPEAGSIISNEISGASKAVIVTDSNVNLLYSDILSESLNRAGIASEKFVFEAGECSKSEKTLFSLLNFLGQSDIKRNDILIALGGGVTGDIAGFAASIFKRGIRYAQIPTTLLSMVDSSVGGKTAIDISAGKNLVGTFWQPSCVIIDTDTLRSLNKNIFSDGISEIIKYGVICDGELFDFLEKNEVCGNEEEIIYKSISAKADYVVGDEHDNGKRQALNFGHTIAHSIEAVSEYTVSHGSAVAIGMVAEARGAFKAGLLSTDFSERIADVCKKYGLPTKTKLDILELTSAAKNDKKAVSNGISFIMIDSIGASHIEKISFNTLSEVFKSGLK